MGDACSKRAFARRTFVLANTKHPWARRISAMPPKRIAEGGSTASQEPHRSLDQYALNSISLRAHSTKIS